MKNKSRKLKRIEVFSKNITSKGKRSFVCYFDINSSTEYIKKALKKLYPELIGEEADIRIEIINREEYLQSNKTGNIVRKSKQVFI